MAGLVIPSDAATKGMWSAVHPWPLVAIHSALLPDGKVVTFGSPVGEANQAGRVFDIWSPAGGFSAVAHKLVGNIQNVDSFCSAANLLSEGRLLASGGNVPTATSLLSAVQTTVSAGSSMAHDRWYGTQVILPDGRALIAGGGDYYYATGFLDLDTLKVSPTPEVYAPTVGWTSLVGASSLDAFGPQENRYYYPRQWVAPNGQVFGISTHRVWYLNPTGTGSLTVLGDFKSGIGTSAKPNVGPTSTAVMFDVGKILQVGGNGRENVDEPTPGTPTESSAAATVLDINQPGFPTLTEQPSMIEPRQWANATVLPNGRVAVTGGSRRGNRGGPEAVYAAEIWDPSSGGWSAMAEASVPRIYHSTALLLPNGTILSSGGGAPSAAEPYHYPTNLNAQVFYPPYLFRTVNGVAQLAPRPRMVTVNSRGFSHGASIQLEMDSSASVSRAVLVGLGTVTHSFDAGQRLIPLSYSQSGAILTIQTPSSPNVAPPGYYMLFVLDGAGVPSRGLVLAVGSGVTVPNTPSLIAHLPSGGEADTDGDAAGDLLVYKLSAGQWNIWSSSQQSTVGSVQWGNPQTGDVPLVGDFDGDGLTDLAVYAHLTGTWSLRRTVAGASGTSFGAVSWGNPSAGDVPLIGDFDGDGKSDLTVYSGGVWRLRATTWGAEGTELGAVFWGNQATSDVPLLGDFNGDGKSDLAVYSSLTGVWSLRQTTNGVAGVSLGTVNWGNPSTLDLPLVGDFNGDGKSDLAVYSLATGIFSLRATIQGADGYSLAAIQWGDPSTADVPVVGDFDGDGKTDIGVFTPETGRWHRRSSMSHDAMTPVFLGSQGDQPISGSRR